jgi:hypothetical protein
MTSVTSAEQVTDPITDGDADDQGRGEARRRLRPVHALLALAALPFAIGAVSLVVTVGGNYFPAADHALTEMQIRDIGRHEVLIGLYSRENWNHPGPMLFYLLAPFYWLTGGASIGMHVGALAINAASVVGMALVARRRGGTPLMLCTLLGSVLLMRTLSAEFVADPWNLYVTVLPFAFMIFLAWTLACGDAWALPVATVVASYLAQSHVGFVVLALPLLVGGAGWLLLSERGRLRQLQLPLLLSGALGGLLWVPTLVDVIVNRPSNLTRVYRYFRHSDDDPHSLVEGWRVITGQFGGAPEWLIRKQPFSWPAGESPFLYSSPLPWVLVPLVVAAVLLWRWGRSEDRKLVVVLGASLVLGVVAVARTLGPAFDYRLRWTWAPPMVAFVVIAWTTWRAAARRWPEQEPRFVAVAVGGLVAVTSVNVFTAATTGTPMEPDSEVLEELMPQILEGVEPGEGQVVVNDPYNQAAWFSRGMVLQLERRGIDARVGPTRAIMHGEHRVYDEEPVQAHLLVVMNEAIEAIEAQPDMQALARWTSPALTPSPEVARQMAELEDDFEAGRITGEEYVVALGELEVPRLETITGEAAAQLSGAYDVMVFLDHREDPAVP